MQKKYNYKLDIIVLAGPLIMLYILSKVFQIKMIWLYYYIMFLFLTGVLMNTIHVVIYKCFEQECKILYYISAIMYNYESLNILIGLMLHIANYKMPIEYIKISFECNLLEILCIPLYIKCMYVEIDKRKISGYIAILFIIDVFLSKLLYNLLGFTIYNMIIIIVAILVIGTSIVGMHQIRNVKFKFPGQGRKSLEIFFILRMVYCLMGIYQSLNISPSISDYVRCIMMYVRLIAIYYFFKSLYYNCIKKPWNELIEKLRNIERKISTNSQNRDTIVNLSHELKTPLNVIQSALQILRLDVEQDAGVVNAWKNIRYCYKEAMKIIVNMINLNKLSGGHLKTKIITCNIVEATENIVEAFAAEYEAVNLIFNTNEEEVNVKLDFEMFQHSGMYILGTILNLGIKDVYVDLYIDKPQAKVFLQIEAEGITKFIREHRKDLAECSEKEIGDVLALEFLRRILNRYRIKLEYVDENNLKICFFNMRESKEEPTYLDNNIIYLQEQIRSNYHNVIDVLG